MSPSSSLPKECQYEPPQGALVSLRTVIAVAGCSQKCCPVHLFISPNSPRQDKRVKNTLTLADCSALVTAFHLIWRDGGAVLSGVHGRNVEVAWRKVGECWKVPLSLHWAFGSSYCVDLVAGCSCAALWASNSKWPRWINFILFGLCILICPSEMLPEETKLPLSAMIVFITNYETVYLIWSFIHIQLIVFHVCASKTCAYCTHQLFDFYWNPVRQYIWSVFTGYLFTDVVFKLTTIRIIKLLISENRIGWVLSALASSQT